MDTPASAATSNAWEKAKAISTILASVVIPITVALAGNWYAKALKDREIQIRSGLAFANSTSSFMLLTPSDGLSSS